MSSGRAAVLVFDEGPGAGLGHRRRMEALAAELTPRAHRVALFPLAPGGFALGRDDIVVIDSYRARADDDAFAGAGIVAALDDLARDLAVDLVVDPSPGAIGASHRRARRVLAGAAYALVPPPGAPVREVDVAGPVGRILVTTGAADTAGVGAGIAGALAAALPDVEVRLVVGPWGATRVPRGVVPVRAPGGLAPELAAASVVVTAGGVALLESCVLGRPTVALALAANQRQAVFGLERTGSVLVATPDSAAVAAIILVHDPGRRIALSAAARRSVDANGARRVADVLEQLASRVGCER